MYEYTYLNTKAFETQLCILYSSSKLKSWTLSVLGTTSDTNYFSFFLFQASPIFQIDEFLKELNECTVMSHEVKHGEYSFKFSMNPYQHPCLDNSMHQLLSIVASLCNGCGGIIYLIDIDRQTVMKEIFEVFQQRLLALIDKKFGVAAPRIKLVQVSVQVGGKTTWAVIRVHKSQETMRYQSVGNREGCTDIELSIDLNGQIHTSGKCSDEDREPYDEVDGLGCGSSCGAETAGNVSTDIIGSVARRIKQTRTSAVPQSSLISLGYVTGDIPNPRVDFTSCQMLEWTRNKKHWEKYVNVKEVNIHEAAVACPMWTPTQPIQFTPGRESMRYLFDSEEDMERTISAVTTREPGFAIVCKTWKFLISEDRSTEERPTGHICDILTVTDGGKLALWVVVDSSKEEFHLESQIKYLMTTGRVLKYQMTKKASTGDDLSNLWIDCRLYSPVTSSTTVDGIELGYSDNEKVQNDLCHLLYDDTVKFAAVQRALAMVVLSKESPLKSCLGDHSSIILSAQQAEVLMLKAKVNYVSGPAGSGKSFTAACLYRMYGKERSVYICTTKEFVKYLEFNGCGGTLVLNDEDLLKEIQNGTFDNKACVIIDDCHNFTCTRTSLKKFFKVLKKHRQMSLFVFADNKYQSFNRKRQQAVYDCILELTRHVLKETILVWPLTEIYRNTRKVVSFVQSAIQDACDDHQAIQSANPQDGQGVECVAVGDVWDVSPDNGLVVYLRSLLFSDIYNPTEIAILFDPTYTPDEIEKCKDILARQVPNVVVHSAGVFPRTGVIVDSVDSFLGLDSVVCVFILSDTHRMKSSGHPLGKFLERRSTRRTRSIYNPRYEVFLASRAIHKAVFAVPEMHGDLVHQMKFDKFQVIVTLRVN